MKKGFLISIEGIDGCGKSLLSQNLYKALKEKNIEAVLTQEPGDTPLGQKLRKILHEEKANVCDKSEFLLFATDRAQHFETVVIPALEKGKIIISDRMADSSVAYQGYGRNLDVEMIQKINAWTMQNIRPDLTFYVKIDIPTAMQRVFKRQEALTSFEKEKTDFWQKVILGYKTIFKDNDNVVTLDGTLNPEAVLEQALKVVLEELI
jgi:dTMP kinase